MALNREILYRFSFGIILRKKINKSSRGGGGKTATEREGKMSIYKWIVLAVGIISGAFMVFSKSEKIWIPSMALYWICVVFAWILGGIEI